MPTGVSTWNQLLSSNRRKTQGSVAKVLGKVYFAIQTAEAGMMQGMLIEDGDETRKWAHCLSQLASVYQRLASDSELSSKLDEVLRLKASALANGRQTTGTLLLEPPPDDDGDETEM